MCMIHVPGCGVCGCAVAGVWFVSLWRADADVRGGTHGGTPAVGRRPRPGMRLLLGRARGSRRIRLLCGLARIPDPALSIRDGGSESGGPGIVAVRCRHDGKNESCDFASLVK